MAWYSTSKPHRMSQINFGKEQAWSDDLDIALDVTTKLQLGGARFDILYDACL